MTVFVDDMRAPYGRLIMCHMISDTEEELHAMADRIGVARKWYQIALSKRALAVAAGAREVTQRELGAMAYLKRAGVECKPETAVEILKARFAARKAAQ